MRRTTLHLTTLAAAVLLVAGCGGPSGGGSAGSGAASPSGPASASPSMSPSLPPTPRATGTGCAPEVQLAAADTGRTVCLTPGGRIRIALDGSKDRPWARVTATGDALKAVNAGIVVQPGDALAAFDAVAPGTARLTSTRPLCAQRPGQASCLGIEQWAVTVTVTAP
ncbi:hypothetical protein [Streptomyces chiangmaiensis]|uniref:DUF4232 domain-containing protein n=1 Tax=Streptomyces chiangmaiensis TaxID=766497 RepID=A0ABU7FMH1_9ACTN|nr:hypothetical protein [Streptomyces chiangmaiensis]MED7824887.1 hypothetical protein [Streptomyces chiangmaiensis]